MYLHCSLSCIDCPKQLTADYVHKMLIYSLIPKNSDDINQCVNNSWSDGTHSYFDTLGLIINESEWLHRRGSAAARSTTEILQMMVSCHRGHGLLGETARDAIPQETSNKTMRLLDRPQSSCHIQH